MASKTYYDFRLPAVDADWLNDVDVFVYGPQHYGASGNGVQNDSTGIQAALNTGKNVYLSPGNYRLVSGLNLTTNYQKLFGPGVLIADTTVTSVVSATNLTGVVIEGLTIQGPNTGTGNGILMTNCSMSYVRGVNISRHGGGGVRMVSCVGITVTGNKFTSAASNPAFSASVASDIFVERSSSRCIISENSCVSGAGYGIQVRTYLATENSDYHLISNNEVDGCNSYGIMLYRDGPYTQGDTQSVSYCTVSGNIVSNVSGSRPLSPGSSTLPQGAGIYIQGAESCVVSDNVLRYTNTSTNSDNLSPGAIGVANTGNFSVTGNTISDCRHGIYINDSLQTGLQDGSGIVSNNIIRRASLDGIQSIKRRNLKLTGNTTLSTSRFGINIAAGSTPVAIPGVEILNNTVIGSSNTQITITYATSPVVQGNRVDARTLGNATATASVSGGALTGFVITNAGSNYISPPSVLIVSETGTGATATANLSGSTVGSITLNTAGSGYTIAPFIILVGGTGAGGVHGISCSTATDNPVISNNSIVYAASRGIDISAAATGNFSKVTENTVSNCSIGVFSELPVAFANNMLSNNTTDYSGSFPLLRTLAASATPSVLNGSFFFTNGGTSITNFTDGALGQTITIRAGVAISIIYSATGIRLTGSSNFNMTAGSTLTLIKIGAGTWDEVSRMVR